MSSTKGYWVIAKPTKIVVDPHFSTLTGHQRDADRKQIITSQNQIFGASGVPHPHNGSHSNTQDKRGNGFDSKLGEKPNSTELGQERQNKQREEISFTDNQQRRDIKRAEHERYKGIVRQLAQEHHARMKIRNRGVRRRRTRQAADASAGPESFHIKAYKAAGLDTRYLWSLSQRNKAKALAQIEPAPDINQIKLFNPRDGMANDLVTRGRARGE